MAIQGSIVLDFGDDVSDDSFVIVELDDQGNTDSEGNVITSFRPEEEARFIVHYDPAELQIANVVCSSGVVSGGGETVRTRSQAVQFVNTTDKVQLSYIPEGGNVDFTWYAEHGGNSPAIDVTVEYQTKYMVAFAPVPAIGTAAYDIWCRAYTLAPPTGLVLEEDETYLVLCVVKMEAATP